MNTPQALDNRTADSLWERYARTRDDKTREQIIHQFERLAYSIANRYVQTGRPTEDLFQVALVGLVKAVDRFDPTTGNRFATFATPTIWGELRRYFRDHTWNVHVPRGTQELVSRVNHTVREMSERLGRTPTASEIAGCLGAPEEAIEDALSLARRNRMLSLDREYTPSAAEGAVVLEEILGAEDRDLGAAEARIAGMQLLQSLPQHSREIMRLRYLEDLSQREVAKRLGISQMKVSRMEHKALEQLRQELTCPAGMLA